MERVQNERWEFDLDIPRSEADDPVRYAEVERDRWGDYRCKDCNMRVWIGPSGLVQR